MSAINYQAFSWLHEIPRDARAQPFADLANAWHRFFTGQNERPVWKKKGETRKNF